MENTHTSKQSQFQLPEKGKYLIDDWAQILGYEPRTMRKHINGLGLRVINFQGKIIIDAETFWKDVAKMEKANGS